MIHIKLKNSIQNLIIPENELCFNIKLVHQIKVKLFKPDDNYLEKSKSFDTAFCSAELSIEPNNKNYKIFDNIIKNKVVETTEGLSSYTIMPKNNVKIIIPNVNYFPEHFGSFVNQLSEELSEAIKMTINNLRWLCDIRGKHNPFSHMDFLFSIDKINWYPIPASHSIEMEILNPNLNLNKKIEDTINELLINKTIEPVYHSLYREAWELKSYNPRSSLVIAITSVEVAVKNLIVKIAPETTWLILNIQSPPIYNIFVDYLPKLSIDNGIKILLPPKPIIDNLKIWISQRNELTHLGKEKLKGAKLKEMLLAVKDILHIIDYNCGHKWALNYISEETLLELGINTNNI